MAERVIEVGKLGDHLPADPWVLVLGGVTREGNRRARRAIRKALDSNLSVVWFDGFGETPEGGGDRVDLDVSFGEGVVTVVDYTHQERRHWLNRMVEAIPSAVVGSVERVEGSMAERSPETTSALTKVRRSLQRLMALFRTKVLRRIAQIFRGILGWRIIRGDIARLARDGPSPRQIIYGDDFALTQGWRAARIWTETPTAMELDG